MAGYLKTTNSTPAYRSSKSYYEYLISDFYKNFWLAEIVYLLVWDRGSASSFHQNLFPLNVLPTRASCRG
jgi:hypothetical protein